MLTASRRRLVVLALTGLVAACATSRPLPPAPLLTTPAQFDVGINDGFHGPLPADLVDHYCGYGSTAFYVRTPHLDTSTLDLFLDSTRPCRALRTLALVEGPDAALAAQLATRPISALEIGNELELPPHELTLDQYVSFIGAAYQAVRTVNPAVPIIMGGVYTLNDDTKARVHAALAVCQDCWVGLHLYEDLSETDRAWMQSIGRKIAITETGSPTGCGRGKWQEQADWLQGRMNLFATIPNVALVVVYQRPSGPSCSNLDTFGLEYEGTFKPADDVLKHLAH